MSLVRLVLPLLFLPGAARAQEEVCSAFPETELMVLLDRVDTEIAAVKLQAAWRTLIDTRKDLRCLDTLVEPAHLARLAHAMAFLTYLDQQDVETAGAWARLARDLHPDLLLPLVPPPTYLEFYDELPQSETRALDGGLAKVKKGAVFLDGYVLAEPTATVVTPHFVQLIDKKSRRIDAWWQDGVAFRDELLAEPGKAPPGWAVAMSPSPEEPVEASVSVAVAEAPAEPDPAQANQAHAPGWISEAAEADWMPDCPWAGKEVVADARDDQVVVNGQTWYVRSGSGADDFREVLQDCHAFRALRRFDQWRDALQADVDVPTTGSRDIDQIVGLFGTAGTAITAEVHRVGLIKALEDPDRAGKGKKASRAP